jgi:hypothetical protein
MMNSQTRPLTELIGAELELIDVLLTVEDDALLEAIDEETAEEEAGVVDDLMALDDVTEGVFSVTVTA